MPGLAKTLHHLVIPHHNLRRDIACLDVQPGKRLLEFRLSWPKSVSSISNSWSWPKSITSISSSWSLLTSSIHNVPLLCRDSPITYNIRITMLKLIFLEQSSKFTIFESLVQLSLAFIAISGLIFSVFVGLTLTRTKDNPNLHNHLDTYKSIIAV